MPENTATVDVQSALSAIHSARQTLVEKIEAAKARIQHCRNRESGMRHAPLSLADYGVQMKQEIRAQADHFEKRWIASRVSAGLNGDHRQAPWKDFQSGAARIIGGEHAPAFDLSALCFFLPDLVHDRLMESLRGAATDLKWGNDKHPSIEERQQIIEQCKAEAAKLELELADLEKELRELNQALAGRAN